MLGSWLSSAVSCTVLHAGCLLKAFQKLRACPRLCDTSVRQGQCRRAVHVLPPPNPHQTVALLPAAAQHAAPGTTNCPPSTSSQPSTLPQCHLPYPPSWHTSGLNMQLVAKDHHHINKPSTLCTEYPHVPPSAMEVFNLKALKVTHASEPLPVPPAAHTPSTGVHFFSDSSIFPPMNK